MYHNTFKVAEMIYNTLLARYGCMKKRSERVPMIEQALKKGGSITCKGDEKGISVEVTGSLLTLSVYLVAIAGELAEEISMRDFELLKILADVARVVDDKVLDEE